MKASPRLSAVRGLQPAASSFIFLSSWDMRSPSALPEEFFPARGPRTTSRKTPTPVRAFSQAPGSRSSIEALLRVATTLEEWNFARLLRMTSSSSPL